MLEKNNSHDWIFWWKQQHSGQNCISLSYSSHSLPAPGRTRMKIHFLNLVHNTCSEPKAYRDPNIVNFKITEQQYIEVIQLHLLWFLLQTEIPQVSFLNCVYWIITIHLLLNYSFPSFVTTENPASNVNLSQRAKCPFVFNHFLKIFKEMIHLVNSI